jgi:ribose/xylose/arabinose/galactoside ABC-type transport system permease subunit
VAIVGILAVGMTFAILTKGIDLSVGSILGLAVVLMRDCLKAMG